MRADAAYLEIYGRSFGGGGKRTKPSATVRRQILEKQGNCCMYCGLALGSHVKRAGKVIQLRLNWDHFMPHSYLYSNPLSNWVAACHICNGIKHSKIFETVIEAQYVIKQRWRELGYEVVSEILESANDLTRSPQTVD